MTIKHSLKGINVIKESKLITGRLTLFKIGEGKNPSPPQTVFPHNLNKHRVQSTTPFDILR